MCSRKPFGLARAFPTYDDPFGIGVGMTARYSSHSGLRFEYATWSINCKEWEQNMESASGFGHHVLDDLEVDPEDGYLVGEEDYEKLKKAL